MSADRRSTSTTCSTCTTSTSTATRRGRYTYHTSHQVDEADPDTVHVIVARYRDVLRRVDGTLEDRRQAHGDRLDGAAASSPRPGRVGRGRAEPRRPVGGEGTRLIEPRARRASDHDHHRRPVRLPARRGDPQVPRLSRLRPRHRRRAGAVGVGRDDADHRPVDRARRSAPSPPAAPRTSTAPSRAPGERSRTAAGATSRRWRRSAGCAASSELFADNGAVFSDLDVLDAGLLQGLHRRSSSSSPWTASTTTPAGRRRSPARSRPRRPTWPSTSLASRSASSASSCPGTGPAFVINFVAAALACGNSRRAQAGRADADVGDADGPAVPGGGHPARRRQRRARHRRGGRRRPGRASAASTPSASPARCETGRRIQAAAAARLKRVALELGGKSAAHRLRRRRPRAGRGHRGGGRVGRLGPGLHGRDAGAGPARHPRRVRRARSRRSPRHRASARRSTPETSSARSCRASSSTGSPATSASAATEGAEVVLGGKRHGDAGYFFEPTIFTGVANYDAHRPGGDLRPGDGAPSRSTPRRRRSPSPTTPSSAWPPACGPTTSPAPTALSRAIDAGTVWVNTYGEVSTSVPYGGVKQSGHGRYARRGVDPRADPDQERSG